MHQQNFSNLDFYQKVVQKLTNQIKSAFLGEKNSLPFIKNRLAFADILEKGEIFQVIIVGGSHFRSCLLQHRIEGLVILESASFPVPVFSDKSVFLNFLTKQISPKVFAVAINFAFPATSIIRDGALDGALICGTKDHLFEGLIGKNVGEEIEIELLKNRNQKIKVALCNDTVSLGLFAFNSFSKTSESGNFTDQNSVQNSFQNLAQTSEIKPEENSVQSTNKNLYQQPILAGVVGTGLNFGFFLSSQEFVNLESGNFNDFEMQKTTQVIDQNSKNPGKQLFEKEVSGKYLFQHFNLISQKEGLQIRLSSTEELDELSQNDATRAGEIATQIFQHSACMVACQIVGINNFLKELFLQNSGDQPSLNQEVLAIIEGSLYWKSGNFAVQVEECIAKLTQDKIVIQNNQNAGVLGCASLFSLKNNLTKK